MNVASLDIEVRSDSVNTANTSLKGLTVSSKETEAATAALTARQDRFLMSLDKQAATMGHGTAALRLYKAEQLGLADDKIFKNLNQQIMDLEASGPSGIERMATKMESRVGTMALRMGVHMALVTGAIGATVWIWDELIHSEEKWQTISNTAIQKNAAASLQVSNLAKAMGDENTAFTEGTALAGGYAGHMERLGVLRAEMMAQGSQFRLGILQENGHYQDQLFLLKAITEQQIKQTGAQITRMEANKPGPSTLSWAAQFTDMGSPEGLLGGAGLRADVEALDKYDEKVNKLYKSMADLTKTAATLNGSFNKVGAGDPGIFADTRYIKYLEEELRLIKAIKEEKGSWHEVAEVPGVSLKHMLDDLEKTRGLADPRRGEMKQLDADKSLLTGYGMLLDPDAREKAYHNLELRTLQLKANMGNTWAIIGNVVAQSSSLATDKMTDWMNATDGLARTWKSAGDVIKNVLHDMVVQMEKAYIQQQMLSPLMQWAGVNIGSMFSTPGATSYSGATDPSNFTPVGGMAVGGGGVAGASVVNVTVNQATGKMDASTGGTGNAVDLGKKIQSAVRGVMVDEMRHGGLLQNVR